MSEETTHEKGPYEQLRESITESVQSQEVPPVLNNQVVFPMITKSSITEETFTGTASELFRLGVCLRALVGRKVSGVRLACDDDGHPSIGWVVQLEDESLIITGRNGLN